MNSPLNFNDWCSIVLGSHNLIHVLLFLPIGSQEEGGMKELFAVVTSGSIPADQR